jgi:hypothetical protein
VTPWWQNLKAAEKRTYSQCGEEGVIDEIFNHVAPVDRVLVDIGAGDTYSNSNTRLLLNAGWRGELFDVQPYTHLHCEHITAENVCAVMAKYDVPMSFELLSLDIDGIDWYVLKALLEGGYRPWVVVVEFQCALPADPPVVVVYDADFKHDGSMYHSGSLGAYRALGEAHGYLLVHQCGLLNAVLIRKDCLPDDAVAGDLGFFTFQAEYGDSLNRPWVEAKP